MAILTAAKIQTIYAHIPTLAEKNNRVVKAQNNIKTG